MKELDNTINILPQYYVSSWKKYAHVEIQKIPFTIFISLDTQLEEFFTLNNQKYILTLFDNNTHTLDIVKKSCGYGIISYYNLLKFIFLYNIKRIYKKGKYNIILSKNIFTNIRVKNIVYNKSLNLQEKKLLRIINSEAHAFCSKINISDNCTPFMFCNENINFFKLINTHFRIFLNRVIIKFLKYQKINKQFGGKKSNKQKFDVFISHAWAKDSLGRNNHKRAIVITNMLSERGIKCWVDKNNLIYMEDIVSQITKGIDNSSIVIMCITSEYIKKIAGMGINKSIDNCKIEFDYSIRRKTPYYIIPVIMDPECLNVQKWYGSVGAYLGGLIYIDLSMNEKNKNFEKGIDLLVSRIKLAQM